MCRTRFICSVTFSLRTNTISRAARRTAISVCRVVWMAYDENGVAGICVVCYAISTSMGSVVAKLDDVSVKPDRRGKGIGSELLRQLKEQLRKEAVTRIDVAVHLQKPEARSFYEKAGFVALNEERLSCLI